MTEPRDPTPTPAPTGYELDVPEPAEPETVAAPRTVRGAVEVSARVVTGAIGIAVAAATLLAAAFLPLPGHTVEPPVVPVVPVAAEQQRVCAGPLLRLGDDSGQGASSASALGTPVVTDASGDGDVRRTTPEATNEVSGRSATVLTLAATGDDAQPLFAGSQWQAVATGDYVGAAAAECVEPSDESWLVGGATTTGRTTLLSIVNPGEVVSTVDIGIFSESGEVIAPGSTGIAIAPNTEHIYSLAGFAPDIAAPVVRVLSSGGQVVATLQQSTVRTLEPGGVDYVSTSVGPTDSSVIPGIVLGDEEALDAAIVGEDTLDLRPALRFFVPGEKQGHATVTMTRAADASASASAEAAAPADSIDIEISLEAGRVTELPLGEFAAGSYTAVIESDVPVVAGARIAAVGTDGANDFAWLPTVGLLSGEALVAVADGAAATLNLANPGPDEADVSIADAAGDSRTVAVPAGGAVTVSVQPGSVYTIGGFDTLHVTVGLRGDGVIAAHTVSPRGPTSAPITIYP